MRKVPFSIFSANGFSLVEVIVAVGLGAVLLIAVASIIAPALKINSNANNAQVIGALSRELSDNVHAWATGNWQGLLALATSSANPYYINASVSPFAAVAGVESATIGSSTYQRYFYTDDVYRDSSGNATSTSSGNSYDPSTKKITIVSGTGVLNGRVNTWSNTASLPVPLAAQSAVVYNGYIYTTGGQTSFGTPISTVYQAPINANGSLGTWATASNSLPSNLYYHAAVAYNGYIYTTGGQQTGASFTSTVYQAPINANGSLGTVGNRFEFSSKRDPWS